MLQDWTGRPERLEISQPKQFIYTSLPKNSATLSGQGWMGLWKLWRDLDLIHWLGPPSFYHGVPKLPLQFGVRGLLKAHNRKNMAPAVRHEPAIHRLQIQLSYSAAKYLTLCSVRSTPFNEGLFSEGLLVLKSLLSSARKLPSKLLQCPLLLWQ